MAKQLFFDLEARNKMKPGASTITKDGVTVAKEIELEDPIENMGAQMVKEVASKTGDIAGDGTTTATVLAQSLISEGLRNVAAGANPMDLKRGIDKAAAAIVESLEKQSQTISNDSDKIRQVATVSANKDETIGQLIAGMVLTTECVVADKQKKESTPAAPPAGMGMDC